MATNWTNLNGGDWNTAGNWDNGLPSTTNQALINSNVLSANGKSITFSALAQCMGLTITGTKTFSISSAVYGIEFYGNYVGSTVCTWVLTGTAYSYAKGTMTVTTNGQSLAWNRWYIDGVGITVTNVDDFNIGSTYPYLLQGIWNTNSKTITTTMYLMDSGAIGANPRGLILGSSMFNCGIVLNISAGLTLDAGTSTINAPYNVALPSTAFTLYNVNVVTTSEVPGGGYVAGFTCNNLTAIGTSVKRYLCVLGPIVVNSAFTVAGNNATTNRILVLSVSIGTSQTITFDPSKAVISNADFRDINCANAIDLSANTTVGNCGGNSGITFCPAQNLYIVHTSGAMSVSNAAIWKLADLTSAGRVPLSHDSAFVGSLTGSSTITCDVPRIGSIDLSAATHAVALNVSGISNISCYGHFVLSNLISLPGTYGLILMGRGSFNLSTFDKPVNYIGLNAGQYTLQSNVTVVTNYIARSANSWIDFNDFNSTMPQFISGGGINQTVYMGNGTMTLNINSGTAFSPSDIFYPEGSTIKMIPASGSADIAFAGASKSYNNILFSGTHTGNFILSGSNTFNNIKIEPRRILRGIDSSIQTIKTPLDATGTAANPITVSGMTATGFTFNYTGTSFIQCDWLNLTNCKVLPVGKWFAGKNSVNVSGNVNWLFRRYIITPIITLIRKL